MANWIAGAIKKPGSLRKALHVKSGHTIPVGKLEQASHSENPKLAKKANLAKTLKTLHRKYGGDVDGPRGLPRLDKKPRGCGGKM